jgi:hypothetical protein
MNRLAFLAGALCGLLVGVSTTMLSIQAPSAPTAGRTVPQRIQPVILDQPPQPLAPLDGEAREFNGRRYYIMPL